MQETADSREFTRHVASTVSRSDRGPAPETIIGQSARMQQVFSMVAKVSDSDTTILINGETGTGKGMVARSIHRKSRRRNKPFVAINCGAIPESLLESELFGHVRGAFTGATAAKPGKFEMASGGTVFLDEIGDMSPDLQVKLLRVLEDREFEPVGGCKTIRADVRIIAATHRDLEEAVQKGSFREDLFYRLYVIPISLPPLKERQADIPLLIDHFLAEFGRENKGAPKGVSEHAMKILLQHPWPGNVRELKNLMERLAILKDEERIEPEDLPRRLRPDAVTVQSPSVEISEDGICLNTAVSEFEKALIYQSLEKTNWVKNKAAKLLHLNRTTLVEKIKRYRLERCTA